MKSIKKHNKKGKIDKKRIKRTKNTKKYRKRSIKMKKGGVGEDTNNNNTITSIFNFSNANAQKKIQTFMIANKDKIKSLFLKSICSDSGVCIAFGTESNNIKKFFSNFITYQYVVPPIIRIGQV